MKFHFIYFDKLDTYNGTCQLPYINRSIAKLYVPCQGTYQNIVRKTWYYFFVINMEIKCMNIQVSHAGRP